MKVLSDFEYKGREIIICENSDYVAIDVAPFYCAYIECEKSLADKAYNPFFPAWITYRGNKFNDDQYCIGFDDAVNEFIEDCKKIANLQYQYASDSKGQLFKSVMITYY